MEMCCHRKTIDMEYMMFKELICLKFDALFRSKDKAVDSPSDEGIYENNYKVT